jgi:1-acyl-sn-glycerol-3-phosphate acyltransferase
MSVKKNNDVNYACICNKYINNQSKVIILYPCSHMLHTTCYKNENCPFCNNIVEKVIHEDDLYKQNNNDDKIKQMIINLESTRLDSSKSFIYYYRLLINIFKFIFYIIKMFLAKNEADLINNTEFLFNFMNIKINVIDNTHNNPIIYTPTKNEHNGKYITWQNQDDKNKKKILIANHNHYLDSFVLYYLFRTGFVASEFVNTLAMGRLIVQKCKLLIFRRSHDTNMVNKIKEYLEEHTNIVIFPEGSMGGNNAIRKFRTGSFYADAHICPIVIKYNPFVWDDDIKIFILKLITQKEIVIDVHVGDLHAPPFTVEQIDKIRSDMIITGQMEDSQVSNRGFKDS